MGLNQAHAATLASENKALEARLLQVESRGKEHGPQVVTLLLYFVQYDVAGQIRANIIHSLYVLCVMMYSIATSYRMVALWYIVQLRD